MTYPTPGMLLITFEKALRGSKEEMDMIREKYASLGQLLLPCSIVNLLI